MSQMILLHKKAAAFRSIGRQLRKAGHTVVEVSSSLGIAALAVQPSIEVLTGGADCLLVIPSLANSAEVPVRVAILTTMETLERIARQLCDQVGAEVQHDSLATGVGAHLSTRAAAIDPEPHALERWARAIVPIIDSPRDLRTIKDWSHCVAASQGAIRNWCRTAGISPRRSLLLGRMLRAVVWSDRGRHTLENLLDVVDKRTLTKLLRYTGLSPAAPLSHDVAVFLGQQTLVNDARALEQLKRMFDERRGPNAAQRQPLGASNGDRSRPHTDL